MSIEVVEESAMSEEGVVASVTPHNPFEDEGWDDDERDDRDDRDDRG